MFNTPCSKLYDNDDMDASKDMSGSRKSGYSFFTAWKGRPIVAISNLYIWVVIVCIHQPRLTTFSNPCPTYLPTEACLGGHHLITAPLPKKPLFHFCCLLAPTKPRCSCPHHNLPQTSLHHTVSHTITSSSPPHLAITPTPRACSAIFSTSSHFFSLSCNFLIFSSSTRRQSVEQRS